MLLKRMQTEKYYQIREVAELLGLSIDAIRVLVRLKRIPACRISHKKTIVFEQDLEDYLQSAKR